MNNKQSFPIEDVLSAYTGVLLGSVVGLAKVLDFMCGEPLNEIQWGRVADEAKPYFDEQCSWLKDVHPPRRKTMPEASFKQLNDAVQSFVSSEAAKHGVMIELRPMHSEDHEVLSPTQDALRLNPNLNIITFNQDEPPSPIGDIDWTIQS